MTSFSVTPVGAVRSKEGEFAIVIEPQYRPALLGLEGFGHIQVLWWCSEFDSEEARAVLDTPQPYKTGPDRLGIFATRSPLRPNPIAVTTCALVGVELEAGLLRLGWIDAFDGTPVLDIKPYTPSSDRVEAPAVPAWCAHWPGSLEEGAAFDWENEFNF